MSKTRPKQEKELPILSFEIPARWEQWLEKHHDGSTGAWLRIQKKGSGSKSLTYAEALDAALCYGWIDGQKKAGDEHSWLQKFTPRKPKSGWSKKNTQHVARLKKEGRMKPAGLAAVQAAKSDGRWDRAYDSPSNSKIPDDLLAALMRDKKAKAFFESLDKTNLYSITYRLQTAKKPETRAKRLQVILEMLSSRKKFHP